MLCAAERGKAHLVATLPWIQMLDCWQEEDPICPQRAPPLRVEELDGRRRSSLAGARVSRARGQSGWGRRRRSPGWGRACESDTDRTQDRRRACQTDWWAHAWESMFDDSKRPLKIGYLYVCVELWTNPRDSKQKIKQLNSRTTKLLKSLKQ